MVTGSRLWLPVALLLAHGEATAAEYADIRTRELQGVSGGNWGAPR